MRQSRASRRKITLLTKSVLLSLAHEHGGDLEDCEITELNFSHDIFELESIDGLQVINWKQIQVIDASNNALDRLDAVLNKFNTLTRLVATNNLITNVDLSLQNLRELDLSRNYLTEIPDFDRLPHLNQVIIAFNEINGGYQNIGQLQELRLLDLSFNKINFSQQQFKDFKETLKQRNPQLHTLRINGNPFEPNFPNYQNVLIQNCFNLGLLNDFQITKDKRAEINRQRPKGTDDIGGRDMFDRAKQNVLQGMASAQERREMPTLESLYQNLQKAKTQPNECIALFKKVADAADFIVKNPQERFVIFKANTQEEHSRIRMAIDSFVQEALMMIEDMPTMRPPVLRVLANLTEVSEGQFGQKCLAILQDLLDSGPEIEADIKEILRDVILPKLNSHEVDRISKDVLMGVLKLAEVQNICDMLETLIPRMQEWIRQEYSLEERRLITGAVPIGNTDRQLHSCALALIAETARTETNARQMQENGIAHYTARLLKVMERETSPQNILNSSQVEEQQELMFRLTSALKIIEYMSKKNQQAAEDFIMEEIHQKLLRDIMEYIIFYKTNGYSLVTANSNEEREKEYYKLVTSYINALAGLCLNNSCVGYLNREAEHIRNEILELSVMSHTDPVLLTAILKLVHQVLQCEELSKDNQAAVFERYSESLQKMLPFLPYLVGKKYKDVCMLAEKYGKGTMVGQEAIQATGLTNSVLHNLFIAIIELISFFCWKSQSEVNTNPQIANICIQISDALNKNDREEHLFHCLEIPNDDVKLAVVRCLDKIPLAEIDLEETGHIVRVLSECKNLGVGRTEEVLAQIFLLLTKMAKDSDQERAEQFRNKFGEMVINECLNIIDKNQHRDLRDNPEEHQEKMYLTTAAVFFLKECSRHESLQPHLSNPAAEEKLKVILKAEERFSIDYEVPVDIEQTFIGKNVDCLIRCFAGGDHLFPNNEVTLRVIQRIADVLIGIDDQEPPNPWLEGEDLLGVLTEKMKRHRQDRIQTEKQS